MNLLALIDNMYSNTFRERIIVGVVTVTVKFFVEILKCFLTDTLELRLLNYGSQLSSELRAKFRWTVEH